MGVSKNNGYPKMDGENKGKPLLKLMILGIPLFLETPILRLCLFPGANWQEMFRGGFTAKKTTYQNHHAKSTYNMVSCEGFHALRWFITKPNVFFNQYVWELSFIIPSPYFFVAGKTALLD